MACAPLGAQVTCGLAKELDKLRGELTEERERRAFEMKQLRLDVESEVSRMQGLLPRCGDVPRSPSVIDKALEQVEASLEHYHAARWLEQVDILDAVCVSTSRLRDRDRADDAKPCGELVSKAEAEQEPDPGAPRRFDSAAAHQHIERLSSIKGRLAEAEQSSAFEQAVAMSMKAVMEALQGLQAQLDTLWDRGAACGCEASSPRLQAMVDRCVADTSAGVEARISRELTALQELRGALEEDRKEEIPRQRALGRMFDGLDQVGRFIEGTFAGRVPPAGEREAPPRPAERGAPVQEPIASARETADPPRLVVRASSGPPVRGATPQAPPPMPALRPCWGSSSSYVPPAPAPASQWPVAVPAPQAVPGQRAASPRSAAPGPQRPTSHSAAVPAPGSGPSRCSSLCALQRAAQPHAASRRHRDTGWPASSMPSLPRLQGDALAGSGALGTAELPPPRPCCGLAAAQVSAPSALEVPWHLVIAGRRHSCAASPRRDSP